MKTLDLSSVTPSVGIIPQKDTVEHITSSYLEGVASLAKSMIPASWQTGKLVILHGCIDSGTPPARNLSAGAVFYNGEVYQVPSASFTTTGLQIGIWTLQDVNTGTESKLTDGSDVHVLVNNKFVFAAGLAGSGDFDETSTNIKTQGKWISGATTLLFSAVTGDGLTLNSGSSKVAYVISGNTLFYKVGLTFTVSDATEINVGSNISAQIELIRNSGLQSNNISGVLDIGMAQYTPLNGFAYASEISASELRIYPVIYGVNAVNSGVLTAFVSGSWELS